MVDRDKAERLLQVLLDALSDLNRYATTVTLGQLQSHRDTQHMVLHALYVAVQSMVDLALHIAADAGLPQPPSYRGIFQHLAEASLLDAEFAQRLEGWAGFRNVLAHFYSVIDYKRVYQALEELDDLERFAAHVQRLLPASP